MSLFLSDELESAGITSRDITLLDAMGTHRRQTGAELRQMLGGQVVDKCRCAQHYGGDDIDMSPLGRTSFDYPLRANRLLVES